MVATEYMCIMVQGFWEKEMGGKKKKISFFAPSVTFVTN